MENNDSFKDVNVNQKPYHKEPAYLDNTEYLKSKMPSTKDWITWLLLLSIPVVNIIFLVIWASETRSEFPSRKNFSKAVIIYILLMIALFVILFIFILMFLLITNSTI